MRALLTMTLTLCIAASAAAAGTPTDSAPGQDPTPAGQQGETGSEPKEGKAKSAAPVLVVLVNERNPTVNLSTAKLRTYFKLERTFWPKPFDRRTLLVLRGRKSTEMKLLLDLIYRKTARQLRDYFKNKNFRGEITRAKCIKTCATDRSALERVAKEEGAITVLLAENLPKKLEGVRVVAIDGKRPGEPGYPLKGKAETPSP